MIDELSQQGQCVALLHGITLQYVSYDIMKYRYTYTIIYVYTYSYRYKNGIIYTENSNIPIIHRRKVLTYDVSPSFRDSNGTRHCHQTNYTLLVRCLYRICQGPGPRSPLSPPLPSLPPLPPIVTTTNVATTVVPLLHQYQQRRTILFRHRDARNASLYTLGLF